jgi:hypothetical protein
LLMLLCFVVANTNIQQLGVVIYDILPPCSFFLSDSSDINSLNTENNPNLQCIEVDSVEYANNQEDWIIDNWSMYSEDCENAIVNKIFGYAKYGCTPQEGIIIRLKAMNENGEIGATYDSTYTDENGYYQFTEIPEGKYAVWCYEPYDYDREFWSWYWKTSENGVLNINESSIRQMDIGLYNLIRNLNPDYFSFNTLPLLISWDNLELAKYYTLQFRKHSVFSPIFFETTVFENEIFIEALQEVSVSSFEIRAYDSLDNYLGEISSRLIVYNQDDVICSGSINHDTTWNDIVIVRDDINIKNGAELELGYRTWVFFDTIDCMGSSKEFSIDVHGSLWTQANIFASIGYPKWGGIIFHNDSENTSINNLYIYNSTNGIEVNNTDIMISHYRYYGTQNSGLKLQNSNSDIKYSFFDNNRYQEKTISIQNGSNATFNNCKHYCPTKKTNKGAIYHR